MMALGMLMGRWVLANELKWRRLDPRFADWELWMAVFSGIIGSRLFDILENPGAYINKPRMIFSGSGLTWYGGFILGAITLLAVARWRKVKFLPLLDCQGPALTVGYAFGRMGCFLSGDGCYGTACNGLLPAPLCMAFPNGVVPSYVDVYNTPLFEIVFATLTLVALRWMRSRIKTPGALFAWFVIIHSVLRFSVELIRRNPILLLGLSQAQVISFVGILIGIAMLFLAPGKVPAKR
jgi:phosphatidylglycerol---prolipoprotein diacylglyceryl transferase